MIKDYLKAFPFLTEKDIGTLLQYTTNKTIQKSDYFIREGETCKEVAFILSGTLRSYYTSHKGEEITYCITFPNHFMTAYSSFITGEKSIENIQAITPVELMLLQKNKINELASENPKWMIFLKIMAEQQYLELEKRIFQLQKDNAVERYTSLLQNQPEYIQQIPLQYLASYLGITQRHLSRIRKELSY